MSDQLHDKTIAIQDMLPVSGEAHFLYLSIFFFTNGMFASCTQHPFF